MPTESPLTIDDDEVKEHLVYHMCRLPIIYRIIMWRGILQPTRNIYEVA